MRLSIFSRLMIGYIALLVMATGMSAYAIIQLGKVNSTTHSILLTDTPLIDLQKNLTDALLSETRYEKKFIVLRDESFYESCLASGNDFDLYLRGATLVNAPPEIKHALAGIEALHGKYRVLVVEERERLKAGKKPLGGRLADEKERVVGDILDELVRVRLLSQEAVFRKVADLGKSGNRARRAAIVITSLSLLFGTVLAVVITRSITRPLRAMKRKTAEIASGVFTSDLDLSSPPEIGELARAFNLMCDRLREVDRTKSDFYALMSHELRTPLASIQEGTNLLLEGLGGDIGARQRKLLAIIAEESKRLIGLVSSLLDLSKLEAGMVAYSFAKAEIGPLIAKTVREVTPLAEVKKIRIEQDAAGLPAVRMDSERILQVLRNLIGNALKFTPDGGVVRISAVQTGTGVNVSVADTGQGIPKHHLSAIFDKYRQAERPEAGSLKGTGLGLAIVRHIIHAHGGKVWAESEPGHGSVFTFVLPV